MKSKYKVLVITLAFVFFVLFIMVADYNNWPSSFGHVFANYNLDFLSLVISNSVVVLLFLITFILLDRRNMDKEENKRKVALVMLQNTYRQCVRIMDILDIEENRIAGSNILPSKGSEKSKNVSEWTQSIPFTDSNEIIVGFAQEGTLNAKEFETYLQIKSMYIDYVQMAFFIPYSSLFDCLIPQREELRSMLAETMKQIDEELPADYHKPTTEMSRNDNH